MYASKEKYDGQRASVGRVVVARENPEENVEAAVIARIDDGDAITITSMFTGVDMAGMQFVATKTEEDVDNLPPGSWTWPVRV